MKTALTLFLALLLASCVSTPPPPSWHALEPSAFDHPLPLAECLSLARSNDVRAAQWEARLAAARAGLSSAQAFPNPTVSLEWEGIGLHDAEGVSIESQKTIVSYPVFFWWPRAYKVAAAEAGREAEAAGVHLEQRQLTAEIGVAWIGLVAGQRRVRIATDLLATGRESLRLARKGMDLGIRSAYDVERAEAEVLKAEGDLAASEGELRRDQLSFAFALGAGRPCFPRVMDTEEAGAVRPGALGDAETPPEELLSLALAADPEWAKAKALVDAAEAELHVEQLAVIPLADVQGSGGTKRDGDGRASFATGEFPVPLLNWNGAGIEKAKAALLAARTEEEKARRAVVAFLCLDWERVRSAVRNWASFAHPLSEKLTKVESSARKLFDAGQIGYAELLQAQRDLKEAQRSEADAWREASVARWTIESALGRHDAGAQP